MDPEPPGGSRSMVCVYSSRLVRPRRLLCELGVVLVAQVLVDGLGLWVVHVCPGCHIPCRWVGLVPGRNGYAGVLDPVDRVPVRGGATPHMYIPTCDAWAVPSALWLLLCIGAAGYPVQKRRCVVVDRM